MDEYLKNTSSLKEKWEIEISIAWNERKFKDLYFSSLLLESDVTLEIQNTLENWDINEKLNNFFEGLKKLIDGLDYSDNINNLNGHTFYDFFLAKFSCLNVEMYGVVTVTGLKLSGAANSDIK